MSKFYPHDGTKHGRLHTPARQLQDTLFNKTLRRWGLSHNVFLHSSIKQVIHDCLKQIVIIPINKCDLGFEK